MDKIFIEYQGNEQREPVLPDLIKLSNGLEIWYGGGYKIGSKQLALHLAQTICDALNGEPAAVLSSTQPDRLTIAAGLLEEVLANAELRAFQAHRQAIVQEVYMWADELISQSQNTQP